MQLEHNVHEQPGDMPNLQIEHLSEHSQVFQDFMISDSPDVRADDSTERTHLQDSGLGLRASVTPSTLWATVTLVTVQTVSIQSADLGRLGLMLWSMGQTELDIVLMSLALHGEIVSHIVNLSPSVMLTQVNLSPASMIKHCRSRSRSSSYDSVSPRRHSRSPSHSRG